MSLELADILLEHWARYALKHQKHLNAVHYRAVSRVLACRTPALGGRLYQCAGCAKKHFAYHSCNHRSCPRCGSAEQAEWSAKQEAKLLPVPYFMVTFTLPSELRQACLAHPREMYHLIIKQSAAALRDVIATKTKGGQSGFIAVLHTWGRQLQHHPHVHFIVPALAWNPQKKLLIRPSKDEFLVHYRPLAARFRSLLQTALKEEQPDIFQKLPPAAKGIFHPTKAWNVQLQHVGQGKTALRYLARYVRRSAIGPKRIIGYDKNSNLRIHWTSSSTGKSAILTLTVFDFIRRWLLHVLPKGFARVRHYGYLSPAAIKTRRDICLHLGIELDPLPKLSEPKPFTCPCCGGNLTFLRELAPTRLLRGPPCEQKTRLPKTSLVA